MTVCSSGTDGIRTKTCERVNDVSPVFIIGAPRSGTTWLQLLLSQHPAIATCNETHLFNSYLSHALNAWQGQKHAERPIGLQAVLSEEEFRHEIRRLAEGVMERILAQREGASVVLEKTPAHVNFWQEIHNVFPNARFIHLVRDPRNVVASLMRAGRGWGSRWADPGVVVNSRRWLRDVSSGLAAEEKLGKLCCRASYERLRRFPIDELAKLFEWIGVSADASEVGGFVERCDLDTLKRGHADTKIARWNVREEPKGFFGGGSVDGAKAALTRSQRMAVEWVTGPMMESLGYELSTRRIPAPPWQCIASELVEAMHWRCRQWRSRL